MIFQPFFNGENHKGEIMSGYKKRIVKTIMKTLKLIISTLLAANFPWVKVPRKNTMPIVGNGSVQLGFIHHFLS